MDTSSSHSDPSSSLRARPRRGAAVSRRGARTGAGRRGAERADARDRARREVGSALQLRERAVDVWRVRWLDELTQNVRYALAHADSSSGRRSRHDRRARARHRRQHEHVLVRLRRPAAAAGLRRRASRPRCSSASVDLVVARVPRARAGTAIARGPRRVHRRQRQPRDRRRAVARMEHGGDAELLRRAGRARRARTRVSARRTARPSTATRSSAIASGAIASGLAPRHRRPLAARQRRPANRSSACCRPTSSFAPPLLAARRAGHLDARCVRIPTGTAAGSFGSSDACGRASRRRRRMPICSRSPKPWSGRYPHGRGVDPMVDAPRPTMSRRTCAASSPCSRLRSRCCSSSPAPMPRRCSWCARSGAIASWRCVWRSAPVAAGSSASSSPRASCSPASPAWPAWPSAIWLTRLLVAVRAGDAHSAAGTRGRRRAGRHLRRVADARGRRVVRARAGVAERARRAGPGSSCRARRDGSPRLAPQNGGARLLVALQVTVHVGAARGRRAPRPQPRSSHRPTTMASRAATVVSATIQLPESAERPEVRRVVARPARRSASPSGLRGRRAPSIRCR